MTTTKPSKLLAILATVALSLSLGLVSPAQAVNRFTPLESTTSTTSPAVWVTQTDGPGSPFGLLQWTPVPGATQYRIHKTGTIRPTWRLFWVASGDMSSLIVTDMPGAIAVYRVTAVVNGKDVLLGRFNYRPKK